jgi:hypothetical protein
MRQKPSSHQSIEPPIPMTSRIGGSAGSPKDSVQSSTPFASIMRSARFTLLLERPDANDAPRARLLEAIRVVRGGEALLSSITRWLIEDFAARTDPLEPPKALLEQITPREREVLVPVARGQENRSREADSKRERVESVEFDRLLESEDVSVEGEQSHPPIVG